jgi:RimJ/RimL family protein N-acetyltransferase
MNSELPESIETEHLLLRRYRSGEGEMYLQLIRANRDHLVEYLPPMLESMRTAEDGENFLRWMDEMWRKREIFLFGAWERASGIQPGEFAGEVYLANADWRVPCIEVGYFVAQDKTGRGYAVEAARALVDYAFTHLGVVRVELQCKSDNIASQRVAERLGFQLEGRLVHRERKKSGELVDRLWYGRVR